MDMLVSREFSPSYSPDPARAMKTMALIEGGLAYVITCDPGDALIVQMSQDAARDYSATRLKRMFARHRRCAASKQRARRRTT